MENNNNEIISDKGQKIKFDEHQRPYVEICEGFTIRNESDELEEKYILKAEKELRETPENVKKGLEELKELLKTEENLFFPIEHDPILMIFLRVTKFYAKSAFDLIRRFYKFKQKHPIYCANLLPITGISAYKQGIVQLQPRRTQDGCRIFIIHVGEKWNPDEVSLVEFFRAVQFSLEAAVLEPMTQVNGVVQIIDVKNLSFKQIKQFTPMFALNLLEWSQECVPVRIKSVHIVNNTKTFEILFNIFRPFIKSKYRNRMYLHGDNFESLLQHIDPSALRPCYGGSMPCDEADNDLLAESFLLSTDEFEMASSFGYYDQPREKPVLVPAIKGKIRGKYVIQKNELDDLYTK